MYISEEDYRRILISKRRVRGSICVLRSDIFSFRAYAESPESKSTPCRKFRTPHSLTTVTPDAVKLTFRMLRNEPSDPTEAMYDEVDDAAAFVEKNVD